MFFVKDLTNQILFIEDTKDIKALCIFKIIFLPIGIRNNIDKLIRSMYYEKIHFFWLFDYSDVSIPNVSKNEKWISNIFIGFYLKLEKKASVENITELASDMLKISFKIDSIFKNTFAHAKLEKLKDYSLILAARSVLTSGGVNYQ